MSKQEQMCLTDMLTHVEVLDGLPSVLGATKKDRVASFGRTERKLVQRQALSTSSHDSGTGSLGEAEGSDRELGELKHSVVVGDRSNNDNRLGRLASARHTTAIAREVDQSGDTDGGSVGLGHI